MMYKTHIIFSLFLYFILCSLFNLSREFYILAIVSISALLPDIDSTKSYINKLFFPGKIVAKVSKHRGFWHSIFGLFVIFFLSLILFKLLSVNILLSFYVVFGYFSHLVADALTISGIKPFWKFTSIVIRWRIKTNSFTEYFILLCSLFGLIFMIKPDFASHFVSFVARNFRS